MRNAFLLAANTLKVSFRKKSNIIVFFVIPILAVMFAMFVYGNSAAGAVKLGVDDQDKTGLAGDVVKSLSDKFKVTPVSGNDMETSITSGKVDCVVIIPQGFAAGIYNGSFIQPEIVSIKGEASTAWVKNYLNIYSQNLLDIAEASAGNKDVFHKTYASFKQEKVPLKVDTVQDGARSKGMTSQSVGFLIMFMMIGAGNTAEIILKEKRDRTYDRIRSAPVSARTYVVGNVLANLVLVVLQVFLTLFFMVEVLKIETYVPFPQLFIILVCFGLAAIGLGLLVVAFAGDSRQANTLQLLIVTPTCMLAGCFWPIEVMPKAAQRIADFLPQRWAIAAVQKLQGGAAFNQVLINNAIILTFALAFFLIAAYRFSRNNSVNTFI